MDDKQSLNAKYVGDYANAVYVGDYENPEVEPEVNDQGDNEAPQDSKMKRAAKLALTAGALLGAVIFTIFAFVEDSERAVTLLYFWIVAAVFAVFHFFGDRIFDPCFEKCSQAASKVTESRQLSIGFALLGLVVFGLIVGLSIGSASQLRSILGLAVFVLFCVAVSFKPRKISWRPVIGGLLLQFCFAILVLKTTPGQAAFEFVGAQIQKLLLYVDAGTIFVFRPFFGLGFSFALNVLPTVIFFSAFTSFLYYTGIMPAIIRSIGRLLSLILGTSASESTSAAGNIFVGQTEAPLLVKPFLKDMTDSELHAVMTGGFATIAGGVLASFIGLGIDAPSLLAASFMSAPAALAISKIVYPETETSKTAANQKIEIDMDDNVNVLDAVAQGAATGTQLAINIAGQLIAFLAFVAFFDASVGYLGVFVGVQGLTLSVICGYLFYPVSWLMGVECSHVNSLTGEDDCFVVGQFLGKKLVVNEFDAYLSLMGNIFDFSNDTRVYKPDDQRISKASEIVATYALCGFANFASIGIQIGGLTPLAPNKRRNIASVAFSAMIAGNVACFMTACIAGLLINP